jgi:hypothetical protein
VVQADALAQMLARRLRQIRATWALTGVRGVPQLELGDRVTFRDVRAQGAGNALDGIVLGIHWEAAYDRGFVQTLSVFDVDDLLPYNDYFIIGVTALGSVGRAYY